LPAVLGLQTTRRASPPATQFLAANGAETNDGDDASVAAKPKRLGNLAPQRVLDELPAAIRTEIEPQLLIHVVADLIVGRILHAFQDILDFFEVVAVVILVVGRRRIERGIDLDFDDVTEIVLWIKFPLSQVT